MFRRKAYEKLKIWKEKYSSSYSALLIGARRVGKSTISEEFAKNEYKSYIKIDFADIKRDTLQVFDDINDLNTFFLRLQASTNTKLYERESVIIFDEIQLFPKVRQAIKYLVKDGRYDYIETGSLISIKKNVKDIVIPSEEYKINIYPMDYEEFLWATNSDNYAIIRELYKTNKKVGDKLNNKLMRDLRIYMAVGGMPQAVEAYVEGKNFDDIDFIKKEIINLYKDDFRKIDNSGRLSMLYNAVPSQLALNKKRFILSNAMGKRTTTKDKELLYDIIDSKTVLIKYNVTDVSPTLEQTKDLDDYKLYLSDTGLFISMLFNDTSKMYIDIYSKLLSDKLPVNMGFIYENLVAQMITAFDNNLFFHTWQKDNNSHSYEIDFLITSGVKIIPLEVKSSAIHNHDSIDAFKKKYSKYVAKQYLLSQKDVDRENELYFKPIYMLPFILEEL